jgi:hypothetical protein
MEYDFYLFIFLLISLVCYSISHRGLLPPWSDLVLVIVMLFTMVLFS